MPRFRRKSKGETGVSDTVDLSESEHAWWATGRVQHTYGYATETSPPPATAVDTETPEFEPWAYDDVFAPSGTEPSNPLTDGPDAAAGPRVEDRDLAEVFLEESSYRALGVEVGASWDEIVLAHRRIAKRCHPDRLIHADDVTRAEGEEQMRAANAAYEALQKLHRRQRPAAPLFGN